MSFNEECSQICIPCSVTKLLVLLLIIDEREMKILMIHDTTFLLYLIFDNSNSIFEFLDGTIHENKYKEFAMKSNESIQSCHLNAVSLLPPCTA